MANYRHVRVQSSASESFWNTELTRQVAFLDATFTGRKATLFHKMTTLAQMVMCSHLRYARHFESEVNTERRICSKNFLDWERGPNPKPLLAT